MPRRRTSGSALGSTEPPAFQAHAHPRSAPPEPAIRQIGTNILSLSGQRCLDVHGNGSGGATGTPVDSYTCTGGANQQWYYKGQLINLQHDLCLDATTFVNNTVLVVNA